MPSLEEKPFVVAIIGGGIGGLFAALSLHHHCASNRNIEIHVYEQASEYKEIGAGIGIGVNAARLLHKLGLGEATNNIAGNRNGVWISFRRWDNGEDIVTVPVDDNKPVRQLPVQRSEFLDLLVGAVKTRGAATLHTNSRSQKLEVNLSLP
jgi:salicylate hydroxylase